MNAFAKSMDNYFVPTKSTYKINTIEHQKRGGGEDISPTRWILYTIVFAMIDMAISNIVANAFFTSFESTPGKDIGTHKAESIGAGFSLFFSALEIICVLLLFNTLIRTEFNFKTLFKFTEKTLSPAITYGPMFLILSWMVALNLMTNLVLLSTNLNVAAASILNFFRIFFLVVVIMQYRNVDHHVWIYLLAFLGLEVLIGVIAILAKGTLLKAFMVFVICMAGLLVVIYFKIPLTTNSDGGDDEPTHSVGTVLKGLQHIGSQENKDAYFSNSTYKTTLKKLINENNTGEQNLTRMKNNLKTIKQKDTNLTEAAKLIEKFKIVDQFVAAANKAEPRYTQNLDKLMDMENHAVVGDIEKRVAAYAVVDAFVAAANKAEPRYTPNLNKLMAMENTDGVDVEKLETKVAEFAETDEHIKTIPSDHVDIFNKMELAHQDEYLSAHSKSTERAKALTVKNTETEGNELIDKLMP
jgi:hypothetical protein